MDLLKWSLRTHVIGSLSNEDSDGNENGEKSNSFRLAKQQLCSASRFSVHFFAVVARLLCETA